VRSNPQEITTQDQYLGELYKRENILRVLSVPKGFWLKKTIISVFNIITIRTAKGLFKKKQKFFDYKAGVGNSSSSACHIRDELGIRGPVRLLSG
jgi:hypothetical protein